ncbi:MAG TPA: FtsX-like permease family protein [Bryobacteraceae bacterium]|nr:FtsX-like permease family protein [Bryobacteraceae bacterium]
MKTMRIPLLAGREFTWPDRANSPDVAIINRKMAVRYWKIALILTAVGAYGVLSYFVTLQRREVGIRLALGATPRRIVRLVFTRGLRLGLIGVGIGVAMAIAVARGMGSMIYGIQLSVPEVLVGCSFFLLCVIGLACYLPARGARAMNPLHALRYD